MWPNTQPDERRKSKSNLRTCGYEKMAEKPIVDLSQTDNANPAVAIDKKWTSDIIP
jgi:hypothetical protein